MSHGEETNQSIILDRLVTEQSEQAYINYAMSVITDRALPDVRDGLKPVHRRILYLMAQLGMKHNTPYKKSARMVGEVIGKLHPHGDSAVYETAVRMAQPFTMLHPLIDGQGNFGSMDGDRAAAMRYTEMRLESLTEHFFTDIQKNVVDFIPNYDGEEQEPVLLPVEFPYILVNGTNGIAVGIASYIPPHNLSEVIDAFLFYLEHPNCTLGELLALIKGPDFPTGGIVSGRDGWIKAMETGRGSMKLRGTFHVEQRAHGASSLVIDSIPFQINKKKMVETIGELINEKKIEGVTDLRDESNKKGIRIVLDLKKGVDPSSIEAQLLADGDVRMQVSISYNMMVLHDGAPYSMGIQSMFQCFLKFRQDVLCRKAKTEIEILNKKIHILKAWVYILRNPERLDRVITLMRETSCLNDSIQQLCALFSFDETQARSVAEKRLYHLNTLEINSIQEEYQQCVAKCQDWHDFLASPDRIRQSIRESLLAIQKRFSRERQTLVEDTHRLLETEATVKPQDVMIMYTRQGYMCSQPSETMHAQNRSTRGKTLMTTRDDDHVLGLCAAHSHDWIFVFSDRGQVYSRRVFEIPVQEGKGRGRHINQIFEGMEQQRMTHVLSLKNWDQNEQTLVLVTQKGWIKRVSLEDLTGASRRSGVRCISLDDDDAVIGAHWGTDQDDVILMHDSGKGIRFALSDVRPTGRTSRGVTGMRFEQGQVVASWVVEHAEVSDDEQDDIQELDGQETADDEVSQDIQEATVLVVTQRGFGKRIKPTQWRTQHRGGKGVHICSVTAKSGSILSMLVAQPDDDLVMMTTSGVVNRIPVRSIPVSPRASKTHRRFFQVDEHDAIQDISRLPSMEDDTDIPVSLN